MYKNVFLIKLMYHFIDQQTKYHSNIFQKVFLIGLWQYSCISLIIYIIYTIIYYPSISVSKLHQVLNALENMHLKKCRILTTVEFSKNSNLHTIEESAFQYSSIENIVIPAHVKFIKKSAFKNS